MKDYTKWNTPLLPASWETTLAQAIIEQAVTDYKKFNKRAVYLTHKLERMPNNTQEEQIKRVETRNKITRLKREITRIRNWFLYDEDCELYLTTMGDLTGAQIIRELDKNLTAKGLNIRSIDSKKNKNKRV